MFGKKASSNVSAEYIRGLFPIGTVVSLYGTVRRVMICGVFACDNNGREYDYVGVLYPDGCSGEQKRFMFDRKEIERVYFRGYDDVERKDFIEKLIRLRDKGV